jgi:phosphate transport system substrate-binding protein
MKKTIILFTAVLLIFSCKDKKSDEARDTILEGKTTILVDETLLPIVEDQLAVFENTYNAKITLLPQSEKEAVISLTEGKADIIILSRKLNSEEEKALKNKKINPRSTAFATDGIALIQNKSSQDTVINLNEVMRFMKGEKTTIKGLVFDNPNSSTMRYMMELAQQKQVPSEGVFSFKTNEEVIKHIAQNNGMIGVVGINWIAQPKPQMQQYIDKINVLNVQNLKNMYIYPSQEAIATRDYPLARDLYIINCQGYEGLGMGFASFIAGEKGQRIILKSGLAPVRIPSRKIATRKSI